MAFFLLNPEAQAMFPAEYQRAHDWMRDSYEWDSHGKENCLR